MSADFYKLFHGKERAYRVFWYWGGSVLLLASLLSMGIELAVPVLSGAMEFLYDTYCALWSYCMWRCAFNEAHHFWGVVFRFIAAIMMLTVLMDAPDLWREESSPSPLSTKGMIDLLGNSMTRDYVAQCQEEMTHRTKGDATGMAASMYLSECLMRKVKELEAQIQKQ